MIGIDSVDIVTENEISENDARDAGFSSKSDLISGIYDRDEDIYKIGVYFIGEDPRKTLRENADLTVGTDRDHS